MNDQQALDFLQDLFYAAVNSAKPENCVPANLPKPALGRTIVIGFGKASAAMAQNLEKNWPYPVTGTVVTRYGHAVTCNSIKIIEAAHPEPDQASHEAALAILRQVSNLTPDDLVICLISGGGSALLSLPHSGISMAEQKLINHQLLSCGANISEINCVRRHISAIKGGHLAQACQPAQVLNLIISDVPGDHLNNIASGPTVADETTCGDALDIIHKYGIDTPQHIINMLQNGSTETLKPDNKIFDQVSSRLIATPKIALEAAAKFAESKGIQCHILSDQIEGEASEIGKMLAAIASYTQDYNQPFSKPCLILSGGETSVTVKGNGNGGRNVECLLSAAITLNGKKGIYGLFADTDGIDGKAEIAGAFISPDTLTKAVANNMSAKQYLANNDGHSFFSKLGDSLISGPTLTNVNDFRALLIL